MGTHQVLDKIFKFKEVKEDGKPLGEICLDLVSNKVNDGLVSNIGIVESS